jgi:nucleotide-binding universal stress UspA family protein
MAVLVPYDGSLPAQNAIEYAITQFPDREIVLLRVIEMASGSPSAGLGLAREKLKQRRKEIAGKLSEEIEELIDTADVEFRIETVTGQPSREIVAFAEEEANDIDQIVVGSHGREGVSRVLLGSVAEKVVRRAPIPVTVVR